LLISVRKEKWGQKNKGRCQYFFCLGDGKEGGAIIEKKIIIIAGPNGAGKTTFAEDFLPKEANCPIFINADLIAAGLAPFDPERVAFKSGRLMLAEIDVEDMGAQLIC
jgi:ATP-dependent protease Clp ATPase subunit